MTLVTTPAVRLSYRRAALFIREFRLIPFRSRTARLARSLVFVLFITSTAAIGASAQSVGWVKGEIRLNLRSGAGTQFKILGAVSTGDQLTIRQRSESWTRVETSEGKVGWIPAGYLENEPPPVLRLQHAENEAATLRAELEEIRSEASSLRESNATLGATDSGQREEIESLRIENFELRAGSATQKWLTGAAILASGMIVGAVLHRNSTRRPSSRIRL